MKKLLALTLALLLAFSAVLPILAVEAEGEGEAITYPALTEDNYNQLYVSDGLAMAADFFRMNDHWNTDGTVYTVPVGPSLNKAFAYDVDGDGTKESYDLTKAENRAITVTVPYLIIFTQEKTLYQLAQEEWKNAYKAWMNSFTWSVTKTNSMRFSVYGNVTDESKEFAPVDAAAGYLQFRDDYHTSGGIVFDYCPSSITQAMNELVISLDYRSGSAAPNLFYNIRVSAQTTEKDGVRLTSFHSNSALGAQYYIKRTIGDTVTEAGGYDTQTLARNAIAGVAEAYAAELQAAVVPTEGVTVTYTTDKVSNDEYTVTKSTVTGTAAAVTELAANFKITNRQNPAYAITNNPNITLPLNKTFTFSQSISLKDGNDDYKIRTEQGTLFAVSAPYNGTATSLNNTNYIGWGSTQSNIKMYAYRHYTRVLSDAEIVQNHFADLCKWFRLDVSSLYDENGLKASAAEIAFLSAYLLKYTFEDDRAVVAAALAEAIDAWSFEGEGEAFLAFVAAIEDGTIDGTSVRALPEEYHADVYTAYKSFADENPTADAAAKQAAVEAAVASLLTANYGDYYGKTPALTAEAFFAEQTVLSEAAVHFSAIAKENNLDMSLLSPIDTVIRERIYETFADVHRGVYYHSAVLQARLADIAAELVEYYFGDGLVDNVATFLGYQMRLYGETAIRAVFEIDKDVVTLLEAHGYTVTIGVLQRNATDDTMQVVKENGTWVAATPVNTVVKPATQKVVYETGAGYDATCFDESGSFRYAYEIKNPSKNSISYFRAYVTIEREGNEDIVFYCENATENFRTGGASHLNIAQACKEEYGIISANIQALTPVKKVVQPVVFIGGENLSTFRPVTDEATATVATGFANAFKKVTGAVMQAVPAADTTVGDTGLIYFVAGDTDTIALVDGNIVFTYTGDGSAALAALATALAAPEDGYPTYAYGNEEPWPVCLLAALTSLSAAE